MNCSPAPTSCGAGAQPDIKAIPHPEGARMARTPVAEAQLVDTEVGKKPEGDGWFVVNVADAVAMGTDDSVYGTIFEGQFGGFPHFGINVRVLGPGRPAAMYHAESGQEAFLVLQGEAVLIV